MKIVEIYEAENGSKPFLEWIDGLSDEFQTRVLTYIKRLARGAMKKNVKALGDGIFEVRMHFGKGYRAYFGEEKDKLILLLTGGDKHTQRKDIKLAKLYWRNYREKNR